MKNVFINGSIVNGFDTEREAYDFAISIEAGLTTEKYDKETDKVTFETDSTICTTDEYTEYLKDIEIK